MDCEDVKMKIPEYAEKSISSDLAKQIEAHLDECESCQAYYVFVLGFFKKLDEEKAIHPNPFLYTRIEEKVRQIKEIPSMGLYPRFLRSPLYYAAIIILALSIGLLTGKQLGNLLTSSPTKASVLSETEQLNQEFHLQDIEKDDISQLLNK